MSGSDATLDSGRVKAEERERTFAVPPSLFTPRAQGEIHATSVQEAARIEASRGARSLSSNAVRAALAPSPAAIAICL